MENIKHIKILKKSYETERQKFVFELHKVNLLIKKRQTTIIKISAYQKEYTHPDSLILSKTIPILSQNIELFISKIATIIEKEKTEIEKLERIKASMTHKIVVINHKIKLMTHFEEKAIHLSKLKTEKRDQLMQDDLSVTVKLRGIHG